MQTGHGDPLTGRLLALGANPSLGADTEIFVAGDMSHVMRFALQSQRALDHRAHAGRGEPLDRLTISPRQAIKWATTEGARALMMEDRIGSLAPGKQADVILIRADDVAIAPVNDPVQSMVLYAGPDNVDTVLIVGRVVKKDGRLVCPREERIRQSGIAGSFGRARVSRWRLCSPGCVSSRLTGSCLIGRATFEAVRPISRSGHQINLIYEVIIVFDYISICYIIYLILIIQNIFIMFR